MGRKDNIMFSSREVVEALLAKYPKRCEALADSLGIKVGDDVFYHLKASKDYGVKLEMETKE
jgi:hypothetical protein